MAGAPSATVTPAITREDLDAAVSQLREEMTEAFSRVPTRDEMTEALSQFITRDQLRTELSRFATRDEMTEALSQFITRDELRTELSRFATRDEMTEAFSRVPTRDEMAAMEFRIVNSIAKLLTDQQATEERSKRELDEVRGHIVGVMEDRLGAGRGCRRQVSRPACAAWRAAGGLRAPHRAEVHAPAPPSKRRPR